MIVRYAHAAASHAGALQPVAHTQQAKEALKAYQDNNAHDVDGDTGIACGGEHTLTRSRRCRATSSSATGT